MFLKLFVNPKMASLGRNMSFY